LAIYYLIIGRTERSAGLLHSHILGLLYSRISKNKAHNFVEVKSIIEGAFEKANWKDKYGYLIGKIIKDSDIEILLKGNIFSIYSESDPLKQLTSVGWKNIISTYQLPFIIEIKGKKILRIGNEI
jgi:hypothetical protein